MSPLAGPMDTKSRVNGCQSLTLLCQARRGSLNVSVVHCVHLSQSHSPKQRRGRPESSTTVLSKALSSSPQFWVYVAAARIFAAKLAEDVAVVKQLNEGDDKRSKEENVVLKWKIGLVGKWAPTLGGSHDRNTNVATTIAQVLKSLGEMGTPSVLSFDAMGKTPLSPEDALKVRGYCHQYIISPLRRQTQIPETYMSSNQWQLVNYKRVPALCMRNSKNTTATLHLLSPRAEDST